MDEKAYYVVQFPLKTRPFQEDILAKRFDMGCMLYNRLIAQVNKTYRDLTNSEKYKEIRKELNEIYEQKKEDGTLKGKKRTPREKELFKELNQMYYDCGLTQYGLGNMMTSLKRNFSYHIDSTTAQSLADRAWTSVRKYLFGNGKAIKFSRRANFNSMQGKNNKTGIMLRMIDSPKGDKQIPVIRWRGLEMPVMVDYNRYYEVAAMQDEIVFNRILRKRGKTKDRYYVQITFKGESPLKIDPETGEFRHIGEGKVGISIDMSTIAVVTKDRVVIKELAPSVRKEEAKIRRLQRAIDRSRRSNNPEKFNEDGTINMSNRRVKWKNSKTYNLKRRELASIMAKEADRRTRAHYNLVNELIPYGNEFYIQDLEYAQLMRRSTKDELTKKGTPKSKKRYGKVMLTRAPAKFVLILEQKINRFEGKLEKINSKALPVHTYSHITDEFTPIEKKSNWNDAVDCQQDLYTAFLLSNIKDGKIDRDACIEGFDNFKKMHDEYLETLRKEGINDDNKVIVRKFGNKF